MSEHESEPVRRLRAVSADEPRETAESVLPGLPRVGALDALLREVDGLRLTLETDLSRAAAAVEAGAIREARDIIDSDRDSLRSFETAALDHLAGMSDLAEVATRAWYRRIPAAPFVAAAAVVGFLVGVVPQLTTSQPSAISASEVSANASLNHLSQLAASGRTQDVRDAADDLHKQLQALVLQAKNDPAAARQGLLLLSAERTIISQSGDSLALGDVLAASTKLSNQILQALPLAIRPTAPVITAIPVVVTTPRATSAPATKPTTKPTPTAKPVATPFSSPAPQPSATPTSPSSTRPSGGPGSVLPTQPKLG